MQQSIVIVIYVQSHACMHIEEGEIATAIPSKLCIEARKGLAVLLRMYVSLMICLGSVYPIYSYRCVLLTIES